MQIVGTEATPDYKVLYAGNVMAQYLDNDEKAVSVIRKALDHETFEARGLRQTFVERAKPMLPGAPPSPAHRGGQLQRVCRA